MMAKHLITGQPKLNLMVVRMSFLKYKVRFILFSILRTLLPAEWFVYLADSVVTMPSGLNPKHRACIFTSNDVSTSCAVVRK